MPMGQMDARWRFHTLVVASGQTAVETSSRNELLAAIAADAELTAPVLRSHGGASYRIVRRPEIEETVRVMHVEAARAERDAERAAAVAAAAEEAAAQATEGRVEGQEGAAPTEPQPTPPEDEDIVVGEVPRTPTAMALAFQRLVANDKQAILQLYPPSEAAEVDPETGNSGEQPGSAARIFLLVDYPSTIAEVRALLCTGEVDELRPHQSSPHIPLLPLVDGVLLVVDPMRELRERRKSVSQSDERRKSITRRVSNEARDSALLDKQQAPISVFQTANPLVRDLFEAANVGSLEWSDFVFVDLPCSISVSEVKPPAELKSDLVTKMDPLMAQKAAFKEWVASVVTTPLPAWDSTSEDAGHLERLYCDLLRPVFEPSVSVGAMVFAMREAVVRFHGDTTPLQDADNNESAPEPFIAHGDEAALRLALSYYLFSQQGLVVTQGDPCFVRGQRIDQLDKAIWRVSDLPGVGNQGRKAMPVRPRLSDAERSVLDTEFACFATAPIPRVHLTRQLLRFEELLGQQWKGKLRVRNVTEHLQEGVLPQRLAAILRENPSVTKEYDEPTDSLLLAAITATAPGRFRTTSWTARDHVRHRPALKDWQKELLPSEEYLTPRTALAATACVSLSAGELGAIAEKCSIAYPADQSLIRLFQTPHAPAWLSVSLDGDVFGLRPQPTKPGDVPATRRFAMQFHASLRDGSQLRIAEGRARPKKPDGHGSITVTHTSVEGLVVTVCSDGTVIQQQHRVNPREDEDPSAVENFRVISGKGVIVCVMMDESRRILLPNGDVVVRSPRSDTTEEEPMEVAVTRDLIVDPETNALVERRPGTGVVVVTHTDGSRICYHADGTCISATSTRSHVLITKWGLADVCIDVDVNLAAQRHSDGEKVAVTKGGLRTRSVVRTRDGTELHVQYNTKVVAEVNGRIVVHKPDGTAIVAKDSGRVEFTSRVTAAETHAGGANDSDDADRDELSHNRVYYFNCREGTLSLCDHEQNLFKVDVGDGRGIPSVNVALAGVLSESDVEKYGVEPIPAKAVVNDPIAPYLFVLHGDGTGAELLRPRDIAAFWNEHSKGKSRAEIGHATTPPALVSATTTQSMEWWSKSSQWAVARTFLQDVRPDPTKSEIRERLWLHDEKVTACFKRLKTPVATAFFMLNDRCLPRLSIPENQFTVVRRLEQLRPMASEDVNEMLQTLAKWRQWQDVRETNKDRFKVTDPRDADVLAQEAAIQRKVVAAYKATRARKKAERQKLREMQRKASIDSKNGGTKMETVQEGDEPQDAQGDDDDEFDELMSDGSDEGSQSDGDVEIDDPDELMWTAFSEADTDATGRLTIRHARQALVQVLGTGVTTSELHAQLEAFRQPEPYAITFDVFADLVEAFRETTGLSTGRGHDDGGLTSPRGNQSQSNEVFSLQHKQVAAGSATEAVRSFSLLRLK